MQDSQCAALARLLANLQDRAEKAETQVSGLSGLLNKIVDLIRDEPEARSGADVAAAFQMFVARLRQAAMQRGAAPPEQGA